MPDNDKPAGGFVALPDDVAALKAAMAAPAVELERPARKRRKGTNLTKLSVDLLRRQGYDLVDVVERWNAFARVKNDLWGIVDIVALRQDEVLAVQVTSRANLSSRRNKIADHQNTPVVRAAGIRIELHGWFKDGSGRWQVKVEDLS